MMAPPRGGSQPHPGPGGGPWPERAGTFQSREGPLNSAHPLPQSLSQPRTYRRSSGSRVAEARPAGVSLGDTGGQSGQGQWKRGRLSQSAWTGGGWAGPALGGHATPEGENTGWGGRLLPRPLTASLSKGAGPACSQQPHSGALARRACRVGRGIPWGQAVPSLRGGQRPQGLPEIPEGRKEAGSGHRRG